MPNFSNEGESWFVNLNFWRSHGVCNRFDFPCLWGVEDDGLGNPDYDDDYDAGWDLEL